MTATPVSSGILGFNIRRSFGLLLEADLRRFGVRRLLDGINFVQSLEFRLVLEHLAFTGTERVLDVASPKLLAAYLAASGKVASIVMTDLSWLRSAQVSKAVSRCLEHFGVIVVGEADGMGAGVRLKFTRQDVRQLARLEGEGGIVGSDDAP